MTIPKEKTTHEVFILDTVHTYMYVEPLQYMYELSNYQRFIQWSGVGKLPPSPQVYYS